MFPDRFSPYRKEAMLTGGHLSGPRLRRVAWRGEPPDPLAHPTLYDGVVMRRIVAYGVDLVILLGLGVALWSALAVGGVLSFGLLWTAIPPALAVLPIAYHGLLIGGPRSATLGMRVFGLEVRRWTGERPTVWQGLLMAVLFYATMGPTGGLVLLIVLLNGRRRTLHDLLSGTVVVRAPAAAALSLPAA